MKKSFETEKGNISGCIDFIHSMVDEQKLDKKEKARAMLAAEEALVKLDQATTEGRKIRINVCNRLGHTRIKMYSRGEEFDLYGNDFIEDTTSTGMDWEGMSAGTEDEIRSILLKSFEDKLSYTNKNGENRINISIAKSRYQTLFLTLTGLVLGILLGVVLSSILPQAAEDWICKNICDTVTTIFMNALKIVIAPVVFFSIITSVSGFGNMSDLGRIGAKTLGFYMLTSVLAISLGVGVFMLLQTGNPELANHMTNEAASITSSADASSVSIMSTLMNIVPANLVEPFLNSDMLQVIFLAVLFGISISLLGKKAQMLSDLFDNLNELFMKVTTTFMKLIPLVTFCAMCAMILKTGVKSLLSILSIVGGFILCLIIMLGIYSLLMLLFTGVNPFLILKKYFPTMLQVFALSSSSASIPINMNACRDELGISPRVYSLTIPLGATINMDGGSIAMCFFTLSFCHVFDIPITIEMLLPLMLTILLISIGMPGIPNASLVGLAMLSSQVGIPIDSISLVMGIWSIIDMFTTANNCLGDIVGTFCVAKNEGLVDLDILYNKQKK